jgi:hypothetical protein
MNAIVSIGSAFIERATDDIERLGEPVDVIDRLCKR